MIKKPKIFYGWWVLVALFAVGCIGPMARYSLSAFFPAISGELGWSRSLIGTAQSISLWIYSLLSLLVGWMVDRVGGRKTILTGGVFCLAGWMLLSSVNTIWQLYLYYGVVMALAVSLTHLVPLQATARKWFVKRGGLAGGIVGSAFALGTAIFSPLLTSAAAEYGWRHVAMIAGLIAGIPIMALAYFVIRDTPESAGQYPDGMADPARESPATPPSVRWSLQGALHTRQFWLLFCVYSLLGIVYNGILGHMVVWAVDLGNPVAVAGLFVTLFNGPSIAARVMGGYSGDRFGKRKIMITGMVCSLAAAIAGWQLVKSPLHLAVFAVIWGITIGFSNTLFAPLLGDFFGRENVGSLFGILTLGWGLIGGTGPLFWGYIYDSTGGYSQALLLSAVCYALAIILIFLIKPLRTGILK